jgi:hypothetical protein
MGLCGLSLDGLDNIGTLRPPIIYHVRATLRKKLPILGNDSAQPHIRLPSRTPALSTLEISMTVPIEILTTITRFSTL